MVKSTLFLSVISFGMLATAASWYDVDNLVKEMEQLSGQTTGTLVQGQGKYSKNGIETTGESCYWTTQDVEEWSSEGVIEFYSFELTVGSKTLSADLLRWDLVDRKTEENGKTSYSQEFTATNKCDYLRILEFDKNSKEIILEEYKRCKNGVRSSEILSCKYK